MPLESFSPGIVIHMFKTDKHDPCQDKYDKATSDYLPIIPKSNKIVKKEF